ncbi:MAG: phenylalanine 4-monooxygenase, partial [Candidatus Uhrbacteria bacterium]|nr:phenylalanine 4-monooxygenase [Candidatus Uhrbacteria bacterium]
LIDPRLFLTALGRRVMYCTQYIRHASKPEYTPEPDIIHEVIGHVPAFLDHDMADFSAMIGALAARASNEELIELERLYWYTIEFGLILENGKTKAFGAGLLSSIGELTHAMSHPEIVKPFRIEEVVKKPYDFSTMQTTFFVMPSFAEVQKQTALHYKHLMLN